MLKARSGATAASFCGFKGSQCCVRSIRYSRSMETPLNSSMANAYSVQRISWSSSHAAEAVNQAFDRAAKRIEESLVSLEHARHENADRLGDRKDHHQEEKNLEPTVGGHGLEVFRAEKGHQQITEQSRANYNEEDIFEHELSALLLEAFTTAKIPDGHCEEGQSRNGERHICHERLLLTIKHALARIH